MAGRKLSAYRARRDFNRTAEPSGRGKVPRSAALRFVIQKHAARRLHYDLRLELGGVFKSWAVTRGPSLDPADRRLAVEVEDHPLDYGDFEGTIPPGEYGGGTVMIWDRGTWQPEGSRSPQDQLRKGELKFRLDGERLRGSWVLVRMRNARESAGRVNWLLIRHGVQPGEPTDTAALMAEDRSVASGRPMAQIAAGRGKGPKPFMRAARARGKANAVWSSRGGGRSAARGAVSVKRARSTRARKLPAFIAPQLATLVSRPPAAPGYGHEVKFDGYRMQLRVQAGEATLRTRKGLDWTGRFEPFASAADGLPDAIIDGEVVALDAEGAANFAALQAALSEGNGASLVYYVFDLLFDASGDLRRLPLRERKQRLRALLAQAGLDEHSLIRYVDHFETAGDAVLESACRLSLEGIISKRMDDPYRSGRNTSWTKSKCRGGHEVVIGGYTTTGRSFRSLLVGVHRGPELVPVGRVGTGFSQEKLRILLPRLEVLATSRRPFATEPVHGGGDAVHWVKPALRARAHGRARRGRPRRAGRRPTKCSACGYPIRTSRCGRRQTRANR